MDVYVTFSCTEGMGIHEGQDTEYAKISHH